MQNKIIGSCMRVCPPMKNEIERLNAEIEKAKAEGVKEFAERLKAEVAHIPAWGAIAIKKIDNLVAEMTETTKLEHSSLCETETYER